jgi:predicted hotdog family 3-hydroxylacyl-ACP dehydratase
MLVTKENIKSYIPLKMLVTEENIQSYIPQKPPVVMIDQLIGSDETSTRTAFRVKEDNIFVEEGLLKEPALVENIAQTAAARAGYITTNENLPVLVGYIGAIKDLEIFNLPKINDNLETEIVIKNQVFGVTLIEGTVRCNGTIIAQCEMKIFIIQPNK